MSILKKITSMGFLFVVISFIGTTRSNEPLDKSSTSGYSLLLAEESANKFGIYDPLSGKEIGRVALTLWPHEIAVSEDMKTAYVSNFGLRDYDLTIGYAGNSVSIIDIERCCEVDRLFTTHEGENYWAPHGVKLLPHSKFLYVNVERVLGSRYPDPRAILGQQQTKMLVFDLETKKVVRTFAMPDDHPQPSKQSFHTLSTPSIKSYFTMPGMHNYEFSPSGEDIWCFSGKTGIARINAANGTIISSMTTGFKGAVRGLSFNEDGTILISATNEVHIIDPAVFPPVVLDPIGDLGVTQLLYSKMTPGCKHILAPAVWEGQVLVIDVAKKAVIRRIVTGIDPVHIAISPDNKFAYVSHGRSNWATEIDLATLTADQIKTRKIATTGGPNGIAFGRKFKKPTFSKLKIGACLPFTGEYAVEGRECRLGLQLWQDIINASGGLVFRGEKRFIDIEYIDTFSSTDTDKLSGMTTQFLTEHGDVAAMVGTYPSVANLPVGRVANSKNIPFLTSTGREPSLFNEGFNYVFGISPVRKGDLTGVLSAIWKSVSPKPRTAIILSSDRSDSLTESLKTADFAKEHKIEVLRPASALWSIDNESGAVVFPQGSKMEPIIAVLKKSYPDLFLVASNRQESVDIVRACAQNNFTPGALAFNAGITTTYFRDNVGHLGQNLFGTVCWSESCVDYALDRFVTSADFERKFYDTYSEHPSELAAGFAACGVVLEESFRKIADGETLENALKVVDLSTFFGPIAFEKNGTNTKKEMITIQFGNNGFDLNEIIVWPSAIAAKNKPVWPFPGWS